MRSPIPADAFDHHMAFLGKTGAGKTTAAVEAVEELFGDGPRGFVIDTTGVWWGIRLSRDAKSAGLPFLIVGGDHGDLELPQDCGERLARLVAEGSSSFVIDTSKMRVNERTRWATDFFG